MKIILLLLLPSFILSCQQPPTQKTIENAIITKPKVQSKPLLSKDPINPSGKTIAARFSTPEGYKRLEVKKTSFAYYLRHLPLKPHGSKVHYYDGSLKSNQSVAAAVVDIDVQNRDLQQCADAVMRLRAEYLLNQNRFDDIHFNFVNGFNAEYKKWTQGYRIKVNGNKVTWKKEAEPSNSYKSFRRYMTLVFSYASTLSLAKELNPTTSRDIQIGDVFIQGGSPGHAIIIVDMAVNQETKKKIFLLAQSYMPAQDIHVLNNPNNSLNNWYSNDYTETIETPEWIFHSKHLKKW